MKNDFLIQMGHRIANRRKELGLTQENVADKMGVSLQTVSCIEHGKKAVRPENLAKLCRVLDVSSDYFLFGERDERQMNDIIKKISSLPRDKYELIAKMAEQLSE